MLINQLPVTLLLGYLWWLERKERKAAQKALEECLAGEHDGVSQGDQLHADP